LAVLSFIVRPILYKGTFKRVKDSNWIPPAEIENKVNLTILRSSFLLLTPIIIPQLF
jgi:hypothetical protein